LELERRLLSRIIQALNEGGYPTLQKLKALLKQEPLNSEELRKLINLLLSLPVDISPGSEKVLPCQLGAQLVKMALDRWEGYLPPGTLQKQMTDILKKLRIYGPFAEVFTALLGALWLREEAPASALMMAQQAEQILMAMQGRQQATAPQNITPSELSEWLKLAQQIIEEILSGQYTAVRPAEAQVRGKAPVKPKPAPTEPLQPATLSLLSLSLFPDTHPQAGNLRFLDLQTAEKLPESAEVQIERLRVGGQMYRVYVEKGMERVVIARQKELVMLRVEGESMLEAGIEPGDLILAEKLSEGEAKDLDKWQSMLGRLVLAILGGEPPNETHLAFLIKRLTKRNGQWLLSPENPAFEEIEIKPGSAKLYPVLAILKPEPTE
jgi:hypothetical protein